MIGGTSRAEDDFWERGFEADILQDSFILKLAPEAKIVVTASDPPLCLPITLKYARFIASEIDACFLPSVFGILGV